MTDKEQKKHFAFRILPSERRICKRWPLRAG